MKQRLRIYISGPLTSSGDVIDNVDAAIEAAKHLIDLGYAPLCPHLTYYIDPSAEIDHSVWMEVDLPWVQTAHAILRLPGASTGAMIECDEARSWNIPVFNSIESLHQHFSRAA